MMKETTGWHYTQKPEYRRRLVYESTDRRRSKHKRCLEAAKKMIAVANVNQNKNVRQTAKSDANFFYRKGRGRKRRRPNKMPTVVVSKKTQDKRFDKWSEEYLEAWS